MSATKAPRLGLANRKGRDRRAREHLGLLQTFGASFLAERGPDGSRALQPIMWSSTLITELPKFRRQFPRVLLLDVDPGLAEPMRQRVLVHLLQMPVPMINMDVVRGLPHLIGQCFAV